MESMYSVDMSQLLKFSTDFPCYFFIRIHRGTMLCVTGIRSGGVSNASITVLHIKSQLPQFTRRRSVESKATSILNLFVLHIDQLCLLLYIYPLLYPQVCSALAAVLLTFPYGTQYYSQMGRNSTALPRTHLCSVAYSALKALFVISCMGLLYPLFNSLRVSLLSLLWVSPS